MKKLVSFLTVLAMLLCACAFADETEGIVGTWYLTTFVYGEQEYVASDLGQSMEFALAEDGTMRAAYNGEEVEGSWTLDGTALTLTATSGSGFSGVVCTYEGDRIVIEQEGGTLFLTRDVPAATYLPAEAIVAEDAAAFNGDWIACYIKIDTMLVSLSVYDAALESEGYTVSDLLTLLGLPSTDFTMADGKATFTDATGAVAGEIEGVFADGIMTLSLTSLYVEDPIVATLTMLASGDMALSFGDEADMTIYFQTIPTNG